MQSFFLLKSGYVRVMTKEETANQTEEKAGVGKVKRDVTCNHSENVCLNYKKK